MSSAKSQLIFWSAAFAAFFFSVWLLGDILTPFVLGLAIAYLLNPLSQKLLDLGVPRTVSALLLLGGFIVFTVVVVVLVAPPLYREASQLVKNLPDMMDKIATYLTPHLTMLETWLGQGYIQDIEAFFKQNIGKVAQVSGSVAGKLASGGQAVMGFMTTLILTPIVAFFMMREWPSIKNWLEDLYPRQHEKMIHDLLKQMDQKLSGFVRGQLTVAFILGVFYAIALSVAGLNYSILIGISAGVLSVIPMVGSTLGLLASVIVAWVQSGEWTYVAIIAGIFIGGQIVEGNFLTPKLVGDSTGLHPLWVLFALMAGGSLFGILGMLLAVPVAAIIGVLLSFAIIQYKNSPLYKKPAPKTKKKKSEAKTENNG